jgi:hypothetical protein
MKAKQDQIFFAYYDTIEETGEVVYCGKGTNARSDPNLEAHKRGSYNKYFRNIARKHKLVRTRIEMLDQDLALKYENWLMEYYHTWVDDPLATEHACNIDGPGTNIKHKTVSQETKQKRLEKYRLTMQDPQVRKKHGAHRIGKSPWNKGKKGLYAAWNKGIPQSDSAKEKNRKSNLEIHKGEKSPRWGKHHTSEAIMKINKPVDQLDKNDIFIMQFPSALEAATFLKLKISTNISACCHGRRQFSGGYKWRFSIKHIVV